MQRIFVATLCVAALSACTPFVPVKGDYSKNERLHAVLDHKINVREEYRARLLATTDAEQKQAITQSIVDINLEITHLRKEMGYPASVEPVLPLVSTTPLAQAITASATPVAPVAAPMPKHVVAAAPAQNSVLLESCNLIPEATKRLDCLKLAVQQSSGTPKQPQSNDLDIAERSFVALAGGLDSGMSYRQYQDALLDVAKSVAIFENTASPAQRNIQDLRQAIEIYNDAGLVWSRSISFYVRNENVIWYSAAMPIQMTGIEGIVNKYRLPVVKAGLFGMLDATPRATLLPTIWARARATAQSGIAAARAAQ